MYSDYNDENENENEDYYVDEENGQQNQEGFKKIIIIVLIFIIFVVLLLILAKGCSKKSNTKKTSDSTSSQTTTKEPTIMIGRETLSLDVGESFQIQADVILTKNTNPIVKWQSEDSNIASVDQDGNVKGESEGETKINAIYSENGEVYSNYCIVTVTKKEIKLEKITLTQDEISLNVGKTFLIELKTEPTDAKVGTLVYSSDDSSVATVNNKGVITAVGAGTTRIIVKNEDDSVSTSMVVVVKNNSSSTTPSTPEETISIQPTGINIAGLIGGLKVGTTAEILYDVTPNNATNKSVTFKSSDTSIATVDNKGIVTGVKPGTCKIIVSTSNNITASIDVTVASNTVNVTSVSIVGDTTFTMKVGGTKYLKYTISPDNATNKVVTFKSSNTSVVFVDSNGIIAAVGAGSATVTITSKDGNKTATVNITVTK